MRPQAAAQAHPAPPPTPAAAVTQEEKLARVALLVLANKQDLLNALPPHEVAEALGLFLVRDRAWQIQGCSAKDGSGLGEGMGWLVRQVR
jgi:ADP-ribosylation factor-like protein 3